MSGARVDAWIWAIRLAKTRSAATALCKAGHVKVNGERAKPALGVKVGDEVRVVLEAGERIVEVWDPAMQKRVSAAPAFEDRTPPPPPRAERYQVGVRDRGLGRPTKRDRRDIERLLGL